MINKKSILSVLLFSLLIVAGCKEEETVVVPKQPVPTKTELLSASPWITTAVTISPALEFGGIVMLGQILISGTKSEILEFIKKNCLTHLEF